MAYSRFDPTTVPSTAPVSCEVDVLLQIMLIYFSKSSLLKTFISQPVYQFSHVNLKVQIFCLVPTAVQCKYQQINQWNTHLSNDDVFYC